MLIKGSGRMDKIARISQLLEDCKEFHTTLSSNSVWNMNSGVNAPDFIDPNSANWRTFKDSILSLDRFIGIHPIVNELKRKVTSDIKIDDRFIDDLIVELHALKTEIEAEIYKLKVNDIYLSQEVGERKKHKLFISHASKDAEYIETIVSLLETIGLHEDEIICSSIPPYCIPLGQKVYDWLVNEFQSCNLHMLFALSTNYYNSPACLNEMGAAWALKHDWTGILLPGFDFSAIKGCIDSTQISIKLDDADRQTLNYRLEEFKNNLTVMFNLREMSPTVWERKRDEFLGRILETTNNCIVKEKDDDVEPEHHLPVIGVKDVNYIPVEPAFLLVYAASKDGIILRLDVNGAPPVITVHGNLNFMSDLSHRESARWQEALDMLINWGWAKPQGNKGVMYELTGTGYEKADMLRECMGINTANDPLEELKGF